jgi:hypothetical protein
MSGSIRLVTISFTHPLTCFWKLASNESIARKVRELASLRLVTASLALFQFLPGYQKAP